MGDGPRDGKKPPGDASDPPTARSRAQMVTIHDEWATEQARLASVLMDSNPPPMKSQAPVRGTAPPPLRSGAPVAPAEAEELALLRARLAPMTRVPMLARKLTELGKLIEDPKTAFVLGFVDGLLPLETIVEVAGLPELDTLRILDRAVDQYVLTFTLRDR